MHFSFNFIDSQGAFSLQPCHSQLTLYARNIPNALSAAPPEDQQVMLETCRNPLILNKTEWKLHHLGFIILIYYDAWSGNISLSKDRLNHKHNSNMLGLLYIDTLSGSVTEVYRDDR
jgi:hypothetical protein